MRIADRYAESERIHNPKKRAVEQVSLPTNLTNDPVMLNITKEAPSISPQPSDPPPFQVSLESKDGQITIPELPVLAANELGSSTLEPPSNSSEQPLPSPRRLPPPFRSPSWEAAEMSYLKLAITSLNNLARSYNLMAPEIAKKPYFSLDRELRSCYADVAPQLSAAIKERAARPEKQLVAEKIGHRPGSVLERFAAEKANIYDSRRPQYGFKEFWADLFSKEKA